MIKQLGQVMLYVEDVEAVKKFWVEQAGFVVLKEKDGSVEIAPRGEAQTSLVLFNRKVIEAVEPELNLDTPSLMFYTDDVNQLYKKFQAAGVTVGELVTIGQGMAFNFADVENNYFAVVERN